MNKQKLTEAQIEQNKLQFELFYPTVSIFDQIREQNQKRITRDPIEVDVTTVDDVVRKVKNILQKHCTFVGNGV